MTSPNSLDLFSWILAEAYSSHASWEKEEPGSSGADPRAVGDYFVSRQTIYQKYFGLPTISQPSQRGGPEATRIPLPAKLEQAALLARAMKLLLEQRLIVPPHLGGLERGIRQVLSIFADYIVLTEQGVSKARDLLLGSRLARETENA